MADAAELITEPPGTPRAPTPRPLSSGALSRGLGIQQAPIPGMADLTSQLKTARAGSEGALKEREAASATLAGVRKAGSEKIADNQGKAPQDPNLAAIPDKFEFHGMNRQEMSDLMNTMFMFATIGGAMTRQPMTAAMNAFSGGLKGLAEGDKIAFHQQSQEFDRQMKGAIAKNQEAIQKYQMAMEKHKGNAQAIMQQVQLDAAAANDSVMLAAAREGHFDRVVSQLQNEQRALLQADKSNKQFAVTLARMDQQDRQFNARMDQGDRRLDAQNAHWQNQDASAREKVALKAKADAQGGKPSATERQHYVDSNQLLKSVDRIGEMLSDPATRQKIDESRLGSYLSDAVESKAIQQFLVRPNLDPKVKAYLTEVANLRNQYYLDMSGKAVTGGEALRNFGAVVQPSDSADDVLNKMSIARKRTQEKMRDMATYFPGLAAINGGGGAAPAGAPAAAAPQRAVNPSTGETMVLRNGQWQKE